MFKFFKKSQISIHKVLIIGIMVFCCAIIISVSTMGYLFSDYYYKKSIVENINNPYTIKNELEVSYQKNVSALFEKYKNIDKNDKKALDNFKNELLDLTVPSKYRDQHFKLVIALDELTTKGKTENVSKQINWLKINTAWLGGLLNQFIINNW